MFVIIHTHTHTHTQGILSCILTQTYIRTYIHTYLGRGTSTSEGVSIAQAVVEHLHNKIGNTNIHVTARERVVHIMLYPLVNNFISYSKIHFD